MKHDKLKGEVMNTRKYGSLTSTFVASEEVIRRTVINAIIVEEDLRGTAVSTVR